MQTLSECMEAKGLGVRELARKAGLDPSLVSKYARGIYLPGIDRADSLGDVLGFPGRQVREMCKVGKARREAEARAGVA